jgi:hypothetical protein
VAGSGDGDEGAGLDLVEEVEGPVALAGVVDVPGDDGGPVPGARGGALGVEAGQVDVGGNGQRTARDPDRDPRRVDARDGMAICGWLAGSRVQAAWMLPGCGRASGGWTGSIRAAAGAIANTRAGSGCACGPPPFRAAPRPARAAACAK